MSDIKYIVIKDEKPFLCKKFNELVEYCDLSISSIRRRLEYSNIIKDGIFLYKNLDPLSKYDKDTINYLLISNDYTFYKFYDTLKNVASDNNFDYSTLCKLLKNKNYKSIGGFNKGRKSSYDDDGCIGYKIYLVNKDTVPSDLKLKIELQISDNDLSDNDLSDNKLSENLST